jgi:hypothetical protein
MLTLAQNKTLDALEYALMVIEEYDKEFQKRKVKCAKDEKRKEDQGKAVEIESRLNDVKSNYKELFSLQRERAIDFVTNSKAYKLADDRIHFQDKFDRSFAYTTELCNTLNTQIIMPIQDKIFLVYDTSLRKASIIVENIQNAHLIQTMSETYSDARVTLSKNWMKLDLNHDGKVTISDLIAAIRSIREIVSHSQLYGQAMELRNSMRRKALEYLAGHGEKPVKNNHEVPLVKIGEENSSTDSIELHNLNEKDD